MCIPPNLNMIITTKSVLRFSKSAQSSVVFPSSSSLVFYLRPVLERSGKIMRRNMCKIVAGDSGEGDQLGDLSTPNH